MRLIQTVTLTSNQVGITFSSIPQTFTDLLMIASTRSNEPSVANGVLSFFGSGSSRTLTGNGSTVASVSQTGYALGGWVNASNSVGNTFSISTIYLPNYTNSLVTKMFLAESTMGSAGTGSIQGFASGSNSSAGSLTSIVLDTAGPSVSFVAGTTISLYGITAGSDSIVTTS